MKNNRVQLQRLVAFLETKKKHYESQGLIPTLELLIEDLETEIDELPYPRTKDGYKQVEPNVYIK